MMKKILVSAFIVSLSLLSFGEENTADQAAPVAEEVAVATSDITAEAAAPVATAVESATAVTPAKLAEEEIPLNIGADKKAVEGGSATRALMSGAIIAILLGVSYYYVRRYKTSNTINKSNMQIKVLSQHYLGPKKSLAIVRVAGESILIGVTDQNISMIKALSLMDDEVPAEVPANFNSALTSEARETLVDDLDEEFSFAGVTDTVSKKIKSMRSFS